MIDEKSMMHGTHYRGQRLRGWLMSEKLDGIRAYWDGNAMWTRGGTLVRLPSRISRFLPLGFALDGEIFAGYGQLDVARIAAIHGHFPNEVEFRVFDAPTAPGGWKERMRMAGHKIDHSPSVALVPMESCESERHAARRLGEIHARGGEGLILREPRALYRAGRFSEIIKLKRPYYAAFLGRS